MITLKRFTSTIAALCILSSVCATAHAASTKASMTVPAIAGVQVYYDASVSHPKAVPVVVSLFSSSDETIVQRHGETTTEVVNTTSITGGWSALNDSVSTDVTYEVWSF